MPLTRSRLFWLCRPLVGRCVLCEVDRDLTYLDEDLRDGLCAECHPHLLRAEKALLEEGLCPSEIYLTQ